MPSYTKLETALNNALLKYLDTVNKSKKIEPLKNLTIDDKILILENPERKSQLTALRNLVKTFGEKKDDAAAGKLWVFIDTIGESIEVGAVLGIKGHSELKTVLQTIANDFKPKEISERAALYDNFMKSLTNNPEQLSVWFENRETNKHVDERTSQSFTQTFNVRFIAVKLENAKDKCNSLNKAVDPKAIKAAAIKKVRLSKQSMMADNSKTNKSKNKKHNKNQFKNKKRNKNQSRVGNAKDERSSNDSNNNVIRV